MRYTSRRVVEIVVFVPALLSVCGCRHPAKQNEALQSGSYAVVWDRSTTGWNPPFFRGVFERSAQSGHLRFLETRSTLTGAVAGTSRGWEFVAEVDDADVHIRAWDELDSVYGYLRWGDSIGYTPFTGTSLDGVVHPEPGLFERDRQCREEILRIAEEAVVAGSSDFAIHGEEGALIRAGGHPDGGNVQSVTKLVSAIAVGLVISDGKLTLNDELRTTLDIDAPVGVEVGHVLTHTTGVACDRLATRLNEAPDRLAFVGEQPLVDEVGSTFRYNNCSSVWMAPIVERAAGKPIDVFLAERLFEPAGIEASWSRDAAGTVSTYGGLRLSADDLARVGSELLKADGLIPQPWTVQMANDVDERPGTWGMGTQQFDGAFGHSGSFGQWLLVIPEARLALARTHYDHPQRDSCSTLHGYDPVNAMERLRTACGE